MSVRDVAILRSLKVALTGALVWIGEPTHAEAYRLVPGDVVRVGLLGVSDEADVQVDIDGQIRLLSIGTVPVAHLTLDEAEKAIETKITAEGVFVDAQASLSMLSYAPVIVTGDVSAPGRYEYIPAMTVVAALGLSGGQLSKGASKLEIDRAIGDVEGQITTLNLEISQNAVQIARLEAQLADQTEVLMTDALRAQLPLWNAALMENLLAVEQNILTANRKQREEFLELWSTELQQLEDQKRFLRERLVLQIEIAESVSDALVTARDLQTRGLQTNDRITRAEQVDADARDRILEIQAAVTGVDRLISDLQLARARYLTTERQDALGAMRTARIAIDDLLVRYDRALKQQSILAGGSVSALLRAESFSVHYELVSLRLGRANVSSVTNETPLLPGDTLIVRIEQVVEGGALNGE